MENLTEVTPILGGFRVTATVGLPPEDEPEQQPAPDVVRAAVSGAAAVIGGAFAAAVEILRPREDEREEES